MAPGAQQAPSVTCHTADSTAPAETPWEDRQGLCPPPPPLLPHVLVTAMNLLPDAQ